VLGHPGGDDDRLGHHGGAVVGLHVGGVEEHVGQARVAERPVAEGGHELVELVELAADAGDLALADPDLDTHGRHQVVHLARRDAVDVGFHDDGPEGTVDPPPRLQEGRE
jgi:hypothetical protein